MGVFGKKCWTDQSIFAPDPRVWEILDSYTMKNFRVLKVRYPNCKNFEGVKILVMPTYSLPTRLDPHFADNEFSPIARFKPTKQGWKLAVELARKLNQQEVEQ